MTSRTKEAAVALRGVVVSTLFVGLWLWLAALVRRYDPAIEATIPSWLKPIGWGLLALGATLAASCIAAFVIRGQGTPAPFDPPQVFVASGPYRYVRNPMYVGAILAILGGGLAVGSPSVVLLAAGFWLLAHTFVLLYEEPALERRFGSTYLQYKAQAHRWLARIPRAQR